MVYHALGDYRQSIQALREAVGLIDEYELISISEQATSLVTTDWLSRYKGEYSERLWVHSYLMMDYLLLGEFDDAQVEARQALKRLEQYPEALRGDHFTRALIALCFAGLGEDNDAYLVYRKLAEDLPDPAPVAADIVSAAQRLGMTDEVAKYRAALPADLPQSPDQAELVIFLATGRIPEKQPGNVILPPSIRFSFPYYSQTSSPRPGIRILPDNFHALPVLSTDLAQVAHDALEKRRLQIIARETVRVAAKETIAQSVGRDHGNAAEIAVRIGLFLLEEPDVRSWQTLPGRLALIRIPLPAGQHRLQLQVGPPGPGGRQSIDLADIELRPGQRVFRSVRF